MKERSMPRTVQSIAVLVSILVFTVLCRSAAAQDFSGTFIGPASKSDPHSQVRLVVVQDKEAVQITRTENGKTTDSRCPFSGSGTYNFPGGVPGVCTANIKGNTLTIDSIMKTSTVRLHTRERWRFSKDMTTLTIQSQSDAPDLPEASAALGATLSFTSKFTRESGN